MPENPAILSNLNLFEHSARYYNHTSTHQHVRYYFAESTLAAAAVVTWAAGVCTAV